MLVDVQFGLANWQFAVFKKPYTDFDREIVAETYRAFCIIPFMLRQKAVPLMTDT